MSRITLAVCALLLLLGPAVAGPGFDTLNASLRASETGDVSKYTESGVTNYYRDPGDIYFGQWYSMYPPAQGSSHGFTGFDVSSIPDTALLLEAEFGFFVFTDDTGGTPPYSIHAYDYAGTDAESLFNAVNTGLAVSGEYESHHGWNLVPVNGTGLQWISARLASDRCRLAIAEGAWGEQAQAHGTPAPESLKPYLSVSYLPTAVEEPGPKLGVRTSGFGVSIAPNPCRGSTVLRLTRGPLDHSTTLAVYDASGRMLLSESVRDSAFVIRTSSLPAGVYVVCCPTGGGTATARFVVEHPNRN